MSNLAARTNTNSLPPESVSAKKVKSNITKTVDVFCRFRPIGKQDKLSPYYQIDTEANCVDLNAPDEILRKNQGIKKYRFTKVFPAESTQEEVYEGAIGNMVKALLTENKNGLVYSYGVTNAGKTHTIVGEESNPGILPRLLDKLMELKSAVQSKEIPSTMELSEEMKQRISNASGVDVSFECFEIYNEDMHDLLVDCKKVGTNKALAERPKLKFREVQKKMIIEDLTKVRLDDLKDANDTITRCLKNRQVANTVLNSSSSRSHTIFRITLSLEYSTDSAQKVLELLGYICVVDLAGSERAKRTETSGDHMKEACGINNSLLVLGRCLQALKKGQLVPFRDCKLTRFLAEYFLSECTMKMITNINPREDDFEESLRVLNYSSVAKETKIIVSEFRTARLESSAKQTRNSLCTITSINTQGQADLDSVVAANEGKESMDLERATRGHLSSRFRPTVDPALFTSTGVRISEEDRNIIIESVTRNIEKTIEEAFKKYTQKIVDEVGCKSSTMMSRKSWLEQFRRTMSQTSASQNSEVKELAKPQKRRNQSTREMAKKRSSLQNSNTLKRASSQDDMNTPNPKIRQLRLKKSAYPQRLPSKKESRASKREENSLKNEENQDNLETPEPKAQRSSFYTSLLKEPKMSIHTIEMLSMKQYQREQKERYEFMLELCGNDKDEAAKFYRQEYNESPPKI
jgi:hypothetical protein